MKTKSEIIIEFARVTGRKVTMLQLMDNEELKEGWGSKVWDAKETMKIWYWKDEAARDFLMGYNWLRGHELLPTQKTLSRTHILLAEIPADDFETVYMNFQGEIWSPNGEACSLIDSLGLSHTSMSMGDIIEKGDSAWIVDTVGFTQLW